MIEPVAVLDIDGVLAEFSLAFTQRLVDMGLLDHAIPQAEQTTWRFRDSLPITRKDEDAVWDYIDGSPTFWLTVPALVTPGDAIALHRLAQRARIVYMTGRRDMGNQVHNQTAIWLRRALLPYGKVILEPDKVKGVAALDGAVIGVIDDRPAALDALRDAGVLVTAMDRLYNRHVTGMPRVTRVCEWVDSLLSLLR